ncbi:MAG TPA: ATP-binding protein [Bacteroidales bacterium]|nr:ATP-binding protein [Bacteroidales bacterium]
MKTLNKSSIRTNLVLLVLLILVPLFAIILYSSYEQKQHAIEYASQNAIRVARNLAQQQKFVEENTKQLLGVLSQIPDIRYPKDSSRINSLLKHIMKQNPSYAVLLQVDSRGELIASGLGVAKLNVKDRKYFKDVMRTKSFSVGEYTKSRLTRLPVLHYAYPILSADRRVESVLIASFDLSYYNNVFKSANLGNDAIFTFIDHRGTIMYHSPNAKIINGVRERSEILDYTINSDKQEDTFVAESNDSTRRLYGYCNLNLPDQQTYMTIYVGIPLKQALAQFQEALTKYTLIWVIAGILIMICAFLFARKVIIKPIDKLVVTAGTIAEGNLDVRSGISDSSSEFGKLAKAIDEMTEKLQLREFERYRAEKELKKLKERFELAVNSAKIGIWDWHIRNNMLIWDKNMFELYELEPTRFSNQISGWEALIYPDDLPKFREDIQLSIKQKIPFRSEFRVKTQTKNLKHIRIFADVILDKESKPVRLIGVNWDISERKNFEKRMRQAREKAETSDKLKSTFLANISHEIRTPIHGIIGFAQILKSPQIPEAERRQYLDIIIHNGNSLMDTVSNIIDISMLDAGQLKLIEKQGDLNQIVKEVYNSFVSIKIQANKNFNFILDKNFETEEMSLFIDEFRVKQIFSNLLDNAFKFTNIGEVRMGYRCANDECVCYVKDTGIGVKKENAQRIFDRFKQVDEGYNRTYSGNGLGLSICKGLVELMGGKIWLEQNEFGSEFYFTLPLKHMAETNSFTLNEQSDHLFN